MKRTRQQKRNRGGVDLRQAAANQQCTLRLDGCQWEPTCLCHYRVGGVSGYGLKSPDTVAAIGCSHCHDLVDRRSGNMTQDEIDAAFGRAMARTHKIWEQSGFQLTKEQ